MDRKTMMHYYKTRITGLDKKRKESNEKLRLERKERRTRMFNVGRNISAEDNTKMADNVSKENNSKSSDQNNKLLDRKIALQKYKQEKEIIKQVIKQKKRPPFVVGIPHHGNSPVLKEINAKIDRNDPKQIRTKTQVGNQRITRANSKMAHKGEVKQEVFDPKTPVRMFPFNERKSIFSFQLNKGVGMKKLTSPHTPTVLKRSAQKGVQVVREKATSNLKKGHLTHKPVVKVLKNVLQLKKSLHSNSSTASTDSGQSLAAPLPDLLDDISEHITQEAEPVSQLDCKPPSPAVVCETEILENHSSDKLKTKNLEESMTQKQQDSPRISSRKSATKEENDVDNEISFQRGRVDNESDRLLSLVEEWESTSLKENIPQDVTDEIDSVIGQTRLLTRDKFNQFRGIVDQYQTRDGSNKITVDDLNGFWDMVYIQVESLDKKFTHLEMLKSNNWEEPEADIPQKKRRRGPPKRKPKKLDSPVNEVVDLDKNVDLPPSISSFNKITRRSRRSHKNVLFKQELENIPVESLATANLFEESVPCTPRRSLRLIGKTPTPMKAKCSTCQTPECDSTICAKQCEKENTSRRSSKVKKSMTSLLGPKLENTSRESSPIGNVEPENSNEVNRTSKRFILRPSKLILSDSTNKSPSLQKIRNPLSVRDENSQLNDSNLDSFVRRSSRLHSAKKVTFDSSFTDKSNLKLPATPYSRKESIRGSFSDTFSE